MKTCLCCHHQESDGALTCSKCGEGSWSAASRVVMEDEQPATTPGSTPDDDPPPESVYSSAPRRDRKGRR